MYEMDVYTRDVSRHRPPCTHLATPPHSQYNGAYSGKYIFFATHCSTDSPRPGPARARFSSSACLATATATWYLWREEWVVRGEAEACTVPETRPVRALPDGLDAREDAALGHLGVGGHLRERDRRMVQHRIRHLQQKRGCGVRSGVTGARAEASKAYRLRLAHARAEAQPGKDVHVVALARIPQLPIHRHRLKRRARRDDGAAVRPGVSFGGGELGGRCGVRQRAEPRQLHALRRGLAGRRLVAGLWRGLRCR